MFRQKFVSYFSAVVGMMEGRGDVLQNGNRYATPLAVLYRYNITTIVTSRLLGKRICAYIPIYIYVYILHMAASENI